jgi:hypothetical protein
MKIKMRFAVITAMIATATPGLAKELPGYPYEVLDKREAYECLDGPQLRVTGTGSKSKSAILYQLCIDKLFRGDAQNILRQSFAILVERLVSPRVAACLNPATSERIKEGSPSDLVVKALGAANLGDETFISMNVFISALEPSKEAPTTYEVYAEGYPNYFNNPSYSATGKAWRKHLSLAARKDLVASNTLPYGSDVSFWASMLGIGFLKNMGGEENVANLPGTLLYELAKCVRWAGAVPVAQQTTRKGK